MVDPIVTTRELCRHALAKRATGLGYELLPTMGIVGSELQNHCGRPPLVRKKAIKKPPTWGGWSGALGQRISYVSD